jgi:hypothetical protein
MFLYLSFVSGHPEIASSFVQEKFNSLVNTHFLQRCKRRTDNSNDDLIFEMSEDLYKIPVIGKKKKCLQYVHVTKLKYKNLTTIKQERHHLQPLP